jgi:Glycine rich protein
MGDLLGTGSTSRYSYRANHGRVRGARFGALLLSLVLATGATWLFSPLAPAAALVPGTNCTGGECMATFVETGSPQYWTIPNGVASIVATIAGGSGGSSADGANVGGAGGTVSATLPVTSGQTLSIVVGAAGGNGVVATPNVAAVGGYGGGGSAGIEQDPVSDPGGAGGGGSFVFDTNGPTLMAAVGGGGGAPGGSATTESGGIGGAGGDAAPPGVLGPVPGAPATTSGAGTGGPQLDPLGTAGTDGNGPASNDGTFGVGGAGGSNLTGSGEGTAGGGGGGYFGGGGGGTDAQGQTNGAGGGGSGFMSSVASGIQTSTNTGDGSVIIVYAEPQITETSGVLRDATTGEAIPNSCVVFSPVSSPGQTNYTNVGLGGYWNFDTDELGPFNLAFYTTATGDCSQPILPNPVPSWYVNQALAGTDEHTIVPPSGATAVAAGASGIVACLGDTALPTAACAPAAVVLSGTVVTTGNVPVSNVCVVAIGDGGIVMAVTDAAGHWTLSGFPRAFAVVVGFVPAFGPPDQPCNTGGPPPVPAAGSLQPVFYSNVWLNLADPSLLNDPGSWALAHGATLITQPTSGINACLTTAPGSVVPRPTCIAALPRTGTDVAPTLAVAFLLLLLGVVPLAFRLRRRHG